MIPSDNLNTITWQASLPHIQYSATTSATDISGTRFTDPESMSVAEAAAQLESLFLNELFKAMRTTVPDSELIPKSMGEKMFVAMQDDHLAREWALQGGMGIGELMARHLSRTAESDSGKNH